MEIIFFLPLDYFFLQSAFSTSLFVWHFLPIRVIKFLEKAFSALPLFGKAIVLAFVFWIVYATGSAGPQPFIYFQF
jgi:alginate O-acetyltransferase complex protein AlgI